ncbi:Rieske [2Fe-2S] iron-sulfur domain-containing protein [Xylariomycetidae sp. FL2044]|nr:Rieske [2Fe-2S] iron-sulfur domain-containing protein [Xylariomycetidae sp. FL2044]
MSLYLAVQLLIAVALLIALLRRAPAYFTTLPKPDSSNAATGLDAVEKGNQSKSGKALAEHVPFDLEKRAIFLKRWMMAAHDSQFKKKGDYRTYAIADVTFLIVRGEDGKLRAFHNVCRHRAYTVVRRPCGNSSRLFCRYHGWQYSTNGDLLKAPEFADVPGFDKSENGLWEIRLEVDRRGFIFVNFATEVQDAFPWSDCSLPRKLDLGDGIEWEMELSVGWRLASLLPWFIDPMNFCDMGLGQRCLTYVLNKQDPHLEYVDDASFICHLGSGGFLVVSALPLGQKKTLVKSTFVPGIDGPQTKEFLSRVEREMRAAILRLNRNKEANTLLDLKQSAIRERLDKFSRHIDHQRRLESAAGRNVNVAVRVTGHDAIDEEAEALCDALSRNGKYATAACMMNQGGELEW